MKNTRFLFVLMLALSFVFSSCDDDIRTSALTIDMHEEATITAYFYAELNKKQLGLEFAPDGTEVLVSISYGDLNPGAGSGNWTKTTAIQNGKIEVTVPATTSGVTVTLLPAEFEYEQAQEQGAANDRIPKIFKVTSGNTISNVRSGQNRYHQVIYNTQETFRNFSETVVARIRVQAIFNEETSELVDAPNTTSVTAFTTGADGKGWAATATVGSQGVLEITVPKGEQVSFEFIADKRVTDAESTTGYSTKRYKFSASRTFNSFNPVAAPVTFSSQLWE
ncbi:hypothetical protein [Natronoflexus pectinivorans]|uniref:Uncharacterized protein n=1 Tax=Natronoflexus pectinivorans TaxID=682526 RepID=A0A4V2RVN5_9BACT|nr:hypothetical protein [Natronoflexus pectinivorans]TCO04984.1 hypothetical protein EV194_11750 [Natronoflexus pectinivorans]